MLAKPSPRVRRGGGIRRAYKSMWSRSTKEIDSAKCLNANNTYLACSRLGRRVEVVVVLEVAGGVSCSYIDAADEAT
jgi:hypothetical protein